jgi:ribose transport system substrate-binding protein
MDPGFANGQRPLPASCSNSSPLLGVLLPNTVNPYYVYMRQSFIDSGTKAGFTVDVEIAGDDSSKQLAQAQDLIGKQACAVALNGVDSAPAASVAKLLNGAGIPVFAVNQVVSIPDLVKQNGFIMQQLGADQSEGGQVMGQLALKLLGPTATIIYGNIGDPEQGATNARDAAWDAVMKTDSNAKSYGVVNSKIDPTVALKVSSDMMTAHPDINVLWASSGPAALGALRAIQALGKSSTVKLFAFCASSVAMTGPYIACAAQQPSLYASMVVDEVGKYLKGGTPLDEVLVPVKVIQGGTPAPDEIG